MCFSEGFYAAAQDDSPAAIAVNFEYLEDMRNRAATESTTRASFAARTERCQSSSSGNGVALNFDNQ
ncbi:MAG: hypothetical protein E2O35_05490 [Proteobacteria bacterium]|nr:MAG: hypothetical protein E2O35_05490 [Pseudomonadota bacterium]